MIYCGQSCRAGRHLCHGLPSSLGGCAALWMRHTVSPYCIYAALQQAVLTSVGAPINLVLPPPPVQWFVLGTAAAPDPILAVQAVACTLQRHIRKGRRGSLFPPAEQQCLVGRAKPQLVVSTLTCALPTPAEAATVSLPMRPQCDCNSCMTASTAKLCPAWPATKFRRSSE